MADEQARSWVTLLTEDMGDRCPADMGDTETVFDPHPHDAKLTPTVVDAKDKAA